MKMDVIKYLLSAALAAGISATAHSEDVPQSQQAFTSLPELTSHINPVLADATSTSQVQSGTAARAPAPPLTNMWVYAVGSSNCGWETTAGLTTTNCDHGGAQLRTAVLEIGYGSSRVAWMNGGTLSSSAMYARTSVCVTDGYYSWPCTAGQTVVGFLNEYNVDGYEGGIFQHQNTSTNSPFNTMSVQISIL